MRNISKAIYAAVLGLSVAGAGVANASGTYTVSPGDGKYTFKSDTSTPNRFNLTKDGSSINCTLTLAGSVSGNGTSSVGVKVTDGDTTGTFFSGCSTVAFTFPWTATISHDSSHPTSATSTDTVSVTFFDVSVDTPAGQCTGSVDATYANAVNGNDTRSYFYFNDAPIKGTTCTVDGTVYANPTDVNVYH